MAHPFLERSSRSHIEGGFEPEEVALALQNVSLPPEALRYDVTPVGLHYTLSHFDIPAIDPGSYRLAVHDRSFSLAQLQALPRRTLRVTLECAGNGRARMAPRYPSMPWTHGAVGTAEWTGVPLSHVLRECALPQNTMEVAFLGADRGFDSGVEHEFGRSLSMREAMRDEVLLAWSMNGQALLPQHGAPLRLVVPGWFGMASVKWLERIVALERPFEGYQQKVGYHYRKLKGEAGVPVTTMKVKSALVPPGVPDWYTRRRLVEAGRIEVEGRAWSGAGAPVRKVELGVDGRWTEALLEPQRSSFEWQRWRCTWDAAPGEHRLSCRATDALGATQPEEPDWNRAGMGNNAVQTIEVSVR